MHPDETAGPIATNMPTSHPALACPVHKISIGAELYCPACTRHYPSKNGVPILINEANSIFRTADYLDAKSAYEGASGYTGNLDKRTGLRQFYRRAMFHLGESAARMRDYDTNNAVEHILGRVPDAQVLVIGAGDTSLKGNVTYTDVAFGKNVTCIADAHDLPFLDQSFDACIACAVLEHVLDPYRCVEEIMRVLKPNGFVYAETPFMQPVHMREHDFTRFTFLGHRRLFRHFDEIRSGICGGPGVSASQLLRYAITSTSDNPAMKKWLKLFALLGTYPLRWLDRLSCSNNSAYDSASGFYFFGSLRPTPLPDSELLRCFRGG